MLASMAQDLLPSSLSMLAAEGAPKVGQVLRQVDFFNLWSAGLLGLDLVERPGMDRLKARVYLAFGNLAKSSPRHVRTGRPLAQRVFETAQQVGDLTYAVLSRNNLLTYLLASGEPLSEVVGQRADPRQLTMDVQPSGEEHQHDEGTQQDGEPPALDEWLHRAGIIIAISGGESQRVRGSDTLRRWLERPRSPARSSSTARSR